MNAISLRERRLVNDANIPACVIDSLSSNFLPTVAAAGRRAGAELSACGLDAHRDSRHEGGRPRRNQDASGDVSDRALCSPVADEGVVKNRGHIWIWYTDDARHMPVQMQARLFWGTITFHLQSVDFKVADFK